MKTLYLFFLSTLVFGFSLSHAQVTYTKEDGQIIRQEVLDTESLNRQCEGLKAQIDQYQAKINELTEQVNQCITTKAEVEKAENP